MSKEEKGDLGEKALSARVDATIALLRELRDNRRLLATLSPEQHRELLTFAGQVARPGPWAKRELARENRKRRRQHLRDGDARTLAGTGIRAKRRELVYQTPKFVRPPDLAGAEAKPLGAGPTLGSDRTCYVCKRAFGVLHFFYDSMCPSCADFNYSKRSSSADLKGRVALVTGSRVKIGYQAAILLLRAGAKVIVTTRFPRDAAMRYAREDDCADWNGRLEIHGLDLRHTPSVEAFCRQMLDTQDSLDFIINNACQTVRRPSGFYQHLLDVETAPATQLDKQASAFLASPQDSACLSSPERNALGSPESSAFSQVPLLQEDLNRSAGLFPAGQLDQDLQQIDLRKVNSWRLALAQVSSVELLEVQLVNAVAPFVLNARLKPLMLRTSSTDKHIVNVSAVEGQFYRGYKTDKHPHTNMAKAALNMMTRTSAVDYVQHGIHMNSVDTGWVSDEDPVEVAERKQREHGFHPPLDIVDGAARIVDPIFCGINSGKHQWGLFLKDYTPTPW